MKNIKNSMIFFSLLPSLFFNVKSVKKRSLSFDASKNSNSLSFKKFEQKEGELPPLENSNFSFSKDFFKIWQHNQCEIRKYHQKMITLDNLHRDILFIQDELHLYRYTHELNLKQQEKEKINNFSTIREEIMKKIGNLMKIFEKKMALYKERYSTFFHPKLLPLESFFSEPQEKFTKNIYEEFLGVIKNNFIIDKKNYALKNNQHFLFFISFSNNKIYDHKKDSNYQINNNLKISIKKNHYDVEKFLHNSEEKKRFIFKKFLNRYMDYFFIIKKKNFYFDKEGAFHDFFSYHMIKNSSHNKNDLILKQFSLFFFHYTFAQQKEDYCKRYLKSMILELKVLPIKEKLLTYKEIEIKEIAKELEQVKKNLFNFRNLYELQNEVMESLNKICANEKEYFPKNEENKTENIKKEDNTNFHFSQEMKSIFFKQEKKDMNEAMKKIFLERKESFNSTLIFIKKNITFYETEEQIKEKKMLIMKNKISQTKQKIFEFRQKMRLNFNDWKDIFTENAKVMAYYEHLSLSYQLFQE